MIRNLRDHNGRKIELGTRPLGRGGEGAVFEIQGASAFVAKVYHKPLQPEKVMKLKVMARLADPAMTKVAAWPTATLHDANGGATVGFVMPRIDGYKEAHTLYSPAHRNGLFPRADWSFLVHTAMNCATAFDAIHANGHVIGDVNQSNVLVSDKATAYLIDCDSFQVRANGRCFPCEVGVGPYTPSELQGKRFRDLERTVQHDRFGLAVLIFHLLFMGRHPFAFAVRNYRGPGDMSLERSIRECRFEFGPSVGLPPDCLPFDAVSPQVTNLFRRAFSKEAMTGSPRPSATDWAKALMDFKLGLKRCSADIGHRVPSHWPSCPWCQIMQRNGPNFFIAVAFSVSGVGRTFDIAAAWAAIERVPFLGISAGTQSASQNAAIVPTPLPPAIANPVGPPVTVHRDTFQRLIGTIAAAGVPFLLFPAVRLFGLAVGAVFGVWWLVLECKRASAQAMANSQRENALALRGKEFMRRRDVCQRCESQLVALGERRDKLQDRMREKFALQRSELVTVKSRFGAVDQEYATDRRKLEANSENMQRSQFLRTQFISDRKISGIGPSRKAVLASYGIETAYDIDGGRLYNVPGIGPAFAARLLQWRTEVERRFRFDPRIGLPKSETDKLQMKYRQVRQQLEAQLQNGPVRLRAINDEAERCLRPLFAELQQCANRVQQAQADLLLIS